MSGLGEPILRLECLLALQYGFLKFDENCSSVRQLLSWRVVRRDAGGLLRGSSDRHDFDLNNEGRTKPRPSRTASTIPAVKDEQLSELMSRGTEMLRVMGGSLSIIMS